MKSPQKRQGCPRGPISRQFLCLFHICLDFYELGAKIRSLGFIRTKAARKPGQGGIDAVKETFLVSVLILCRGQHGIYQPVENKVWACVDRPSSGALRELMPQAFHRKLQ